ncbi:hypothetical protein CR513_51189, partial [Mucuna pruriens]
MASKESRRPVWRIDFVNSSKRVNLHGRLWTPKIWHSSFPARRGLCRPSDHRCIPRQEGQRQKPCHNNTSQHLVLPEHFYERNGKGMISTIKSVLVRLLKFTFPINLGFPYDDRQTFVQCHTEDLHNRYLISW